MINSYTNIKGPVLLLVILLAGSHNLFAQACATAERTQNTSLASPPMPSGNYAVSGLNSTGWTGSGTGSVSSGSNGTSFSQDGTNQTFTQAITNANLKGNGATITLVIALSNANPSNSGTATFTVAYGGTTYGSTTISTGSPNSASFTNAGSAATVSPTTVPVTAAGSSNFATITITLPASVPNSGNLVLNFSSGASSGDFLVKSISFKACPVNFSGSVLDDANGLTDGLVNSTGSAALPSPLFVNLVNNTNTIIASGTVASGNYNFSYIPAAGASVASSYTLQLSTSATTTATAPLGWAFTGESGTNGGASDGTVDGKFTVSLTNNTTNTDQTAFFGIDAIPTAKAVSKGPLPTWQFPLTDVAGYRGILSSDANTAPLSGNDTEDGPLGTGSSFKIISIASGTQLYYGTTSAAGNLLSVGSTITNYNPSLLRMYGATNSTGPSFTYASVDKANVTSPAQTYNVFSSNPLPVTLSNFSVKVSDCEAIVNWAGTVENNFSYYEVQQSTDEQNFTTAEKVTGKGSGTSYTSRFTLSANTEYVRLKMTDNNGTISYSNILPVTSNCANNLAPGLYPNPTSGSFTINNLGTGKKDILINAVNGALVYKGNTSNIQVTINSANWAPGIYFVKISTGGNVKVIKVVKQ